MRVQDFCTFCILKVIVKTQKDTTFVFLGRHDTQHNDTQHNDIQHNDTQH